MTFSTLITRCRAATRNRQVPRARVRRRQVVAGWPGSVRPACESLERRALLSAEFGAAFALGGVDGAEGMDVAVDAADNVYVVGTFSGTMDADPAPDREALLQSAGGSGDGFLAKYDAAGALVWARQMGGAGYDQARGVAVDASGNVCVTGSYEGDALGEGITAQFGDHTLGGTGWEDVFVTKLDANGTFLWADGLSGVTESGAGYDLAVDDAGNVFTTGSVNLNWPFNTMFVMKHATSGQREWLHTVGDSNADGFGIAVDGAGNSFVTGHYVGQVDFDPGPGTFLLDSISSKSKGWTYTTADAYVLALDPAGNFRWAGSMGSTGDDQGLGIAFDDAASLHVTGQFGAGLFDGENPPVSGSDFDPGSGTLSLSSAGSMDIFAVRLTDNGNLIWGRSMGGTDWDFGSDVTVDGTGDVYLTGGFGYNSGSLAASSADLDPGAEIYALSSAGTTDIFVSKLDSAGDFAWAAGMGGANEESGMRIAVDGSGGVHTVGSFVGQVDFAPGDGTHALTSASSWKDAFVSKLVQIELPPAPPTLAVGDAMVTEGNSGTTTVTFTVTRSGDTSQEATVAYATADRSATLADDYQAISGTLTFARGEASKAVTVLVNGDRVGEPDETFFVNLSGATNAIIDDGRGVGTVADDEPRISINDVARKEGHSGTSYLTFTVALSAAYDEAVAVKFATADGTATAGEDYTAASGTLTFAAGETSKTVTIAVMGDKQKETNESFDLNLLGATSAFLLDGLGIGTILDDDNRN